MKKSKVGKQLRKLETREAIEKRRNNKPLDPFASLLVSTKRHNPVASRDYQDYDDNEEYYYGQS